MPATYSTARSTDSADFNAPIRVTNTPKHEQLAQSIFHLDNSISELSRLLARVRGEPFAPIEQGGTPTPSLQEFLDLAPKELATRAQKLYSMVQELESALF